MTGSVRGGGVYSEDVNFVFFLDPSEPTVVSCMGVAASAANPDWTWGENAD